MCHTPLPHLTEEVVQQVFVMFVSNAEKYDFNGNIKAFLSLMTENVAKQVWRNESRHFPARLRAVAESMNISEDKDEKDYSSVLEMLRQCLEKAPEKTRELVRLHYLEEVSVAGLSERTGMKSDAIYQAIYRLREKLKQCIDRAAKGGSVYV